MRNPKYIRLGSLNEPKAVSIILFLSNSPNSTLVDLKGISLADIRTTRILDDMAADGLLSVSSQDNARTKATYQLTGKGHRVADKLNEIGRIMLEKHEDDGLEEQSISHELVHTISKNVSNSR